MPITARMRKPRPRVSSKRVEVGVGGRRARLDAPWSTAPDQIAGRETDPGNAGVAIAASCCDPRVDGSAAQGGLLLHA